MQSNKLYQQADIAEAESHDASASYKLPPYAKFALPTHTSAPRDVVIRQGAAILELLAREDQALLIRRDALLVLDLRLHVVDRVRGLDLQRDRLTGESLYENLIAERRGGGDGV